MAWPKGVSRKEYNQRGGMEQVKAQAIQAAPTGKTAQLPSQASSVIANAKVVEAVPQTFGETPPTERLFPDFRDGKPIVEPPSATPDEIADAQKKEEAESQEKTETVKAEEKTEPKKDEPEPKKEDTVDFESIFDKYGDRKIKVKIDGEEREVPLADIKKNYQIDQHLHKRGFQVNEERRKLIEEREKFEAARRQMSEPSKEESILEGDPAGQKISRLEQELAVLRESLSPVMYQSARNSLAEELKAEGYSDLMDYIPRMDSYVATVKTEGEFKYYNTPQGAKALYYKLKLDDMKTAKPEPIKTETPGIPAKENPPIIKIDSGTNSSRGVLDDWQTKYQAALTRAKKNPADKESWNEVLRIKGVLK